MERLRWAVTAAAALALGPGCAGGKFWKGSEPVGKVPEGIPTAALSPTVTGVRDNAVVQASATTPASSFSPFGKKAEKKSPAAEMTILWRNRIDQLPNPARNGEMISGMVGQMFLLDGRDLPAVVDGKLTIALYDESPRPAGVAPNRPEGWEFDAATLKKLRTPDERFGMSYALFLPWPTYRPDVTRVRIAVRYDPAEGFPLYAKDTYITIDTSVPGSEGTGWTNNPVVPNIGPQPPGAFNALGGPPPAAGAGPGFGVTASSPLGAAPPAGPAMPMMAPVAVGPAPANFGAVPPVAGPPGRPISPAELQNLPPIAITLPARQQR